jgi:preprotein translocase subunit SecB
MADTNGAAPEQPRMQVVGQFIRDLSFENIAAQKGADASASPDIQVQVNLDASKRPTDGQFNVVVKLNIEAKSGENATPIFLMELDYGGIFKIDNLPDDQLHPFLMIECPRMLFPFIRRIVHDISRDAGYPPLNLDNIDFLALYRNEVERRAKEEKKPN